jgi:hypothetical protein
MDKKIGIIASLALVAVPGLGMKYVTVSAMSSASAAESVAPAAAPVAAAPAVAAPAAPVAAVEPAPAPSEEGGWLWLMKKAQAAIGDWKALGWQAGLMALLVLLIGTFKNSILRKYLWDWAGNFKVLLPYVFALIMVLLSIPSGQWSLATLFLALTTGGGAVAINNLLAALEQSKLVGDKYVWLLDLIGKFLKKPEAKPVA